MQHLRTTAVLALVAALASLAACGSPAPAKPCSVKQNPDGSATITCPDGTSATVKKGQDGSACSVTDNGDGTKTIACTDGTSVTVSDGTNGTNGSSCTVTDNGDGTKTITCPDGTTATVADGQNGVAGLTLVQGTNGVSCPAGTKVASFGTVAGTTMLKVEFLFQVSAPSTLYSSDALPAGPPAQGVGTHALFEVQAGGGTVLYDTSNVFWTTTSPFTATDASYKLAWTHDPSAPDQASDPTVGMYAFGSATPTLPDGTQATNVTGRIAIFDNSSSSDIYQLLVDGEVPVSAGPSLGIPAVSAAPVQVNAALTRVSLGTWPCPKPDPSSGICLADWASVDVYAICATVP